MNAAWPALINGTIASAAVAAAIWGALRIAPRDAVPASARYVIWWIALAVTVALPLFYLPVSGSASSGGLAVVSVSMPAGAAAGSAAPPRHPGPVWEPVRIVDGAWMPRVLALWLMASSLLLLRVALSWAALRRKRARAVEAPAPFQRRLPVWLARAGVAGRRVRLAASEEISIPVAAGPDCPSILIPARLFDELSDEELDQVGTHEAAHLARWDDYALLGQRVAEAIFPLHPVVRWIARQIDLEREIACDDRVVASTGNPRAYAACLTRMLGLRSGGRAGLAAATMADRRSHVSRRVELLVAQSQRPGTRLVPARLLASALALAAVVCVLVRAPGVVAFASTAATAPRISLLPAPVAEVSPAAPSPVRRVPAVHRERTIAQNTTPAPSQSDQPAPAAARLLALYFDLPALAGSDRARAVAAAQKFISSQMRPSDRVAVFAVNGVGLKVVQDFTADGAALHTAIETVAGGPDIPASTTAWLDHLQSAIQLLGRVAGKKAVLYFGTRPQTPDNEETQAAIQAAVAANVAIYVIDASGSIAPPRR